MTESPGRGAFPAGEHVVDIEVRAITEPTAEERAIPQTEGRPTSPSWIRLSEEHTKADEWLDPEIIEIMMCAATRLHIPREDYTRYLSLKYASVRRIPDGLSAVQRAEQGKMLYRALEEPDYRPKAVAHIRKVGKMPPEHVGKP